MAGRSPGFSTNSHHQLCTVLESSTERDDAESHVHATTDSFSSSFYVGNGTDSLSSSTRAEPYYSEDSSGREEVRFRLQAPPPRPFFPVDQNYGTADHHHRKDSEMKMLVHLRRHSKAKSHHHHHNGLSRTRLTHSLTSLDKKGALWSKFYSDDDVNIKRVLDAVAGDHVVLTDPADNKHRRTIVLERTPHEKFGFTVQSYTFRNVESGLFERLSYVDYVEINSPANLAGLRAGDVILSINGQNAREKEHEALVSYISECLTMRMSVLFENCLQKIDLFSRAIKLRKLLCDKEFDLRVLSLQEERLLQGLPLMRAHEYLPLLRSVADSSENGSLGSLASASPGGGTLDFSDDTSSSNTGTGSVFADDNQHIDQNMTDCDRGPMAIVSEVDEDSDYDNDALSEPCEHGLEDSPEPSATIDISQQNHFQDDNHSVGSCREQLNADCSSTVSDDDNSASAYADDKQIIIKF